jgi:hypothetical protein
MGEVACYQVVLLEPGRKVEPGGGRSATLRATLERRLEVLGLDPRTALRVLDGTSFHREQDPFLPLVAVYFGGQRQDSEATAILEQLRSEGRFVLPVVPTLMRYTDQVPPLLAPISGEELRASDPALDHVASRVLEELRLMRARRLVFISYKRDESSGVALQLYQALEARAFEVFLDTHSIKRGEEFQPMLWDRLGDADLLILLDTPKAFTSTWVEQEVARAHNLGLGVLQLVWPEPHARTLGTELCEPVLLQTRDFQGSPADVGAILQSGKVEEIVALAEATRARSLASRRTRVVTEFCKQLKERGLEVVLQSTGHLEITHPVRGAMHIFPVVGHPDALLLQEINDTCTKAGPTPPRGCIVYDALGIWSRRAAHLRWLNDFLPAETLAVTEVLTWLNTTSAR